MRAHATIIRKGLMRKSADMKWALISVFIIPLLFSVPQAGAQGESEETPEEIVEIKEITGKMVFLTGRMITIEFARTKTGSTEILIFYDKKTKLSHLKSMEDFQQGDTVKVTYKESYIEGEDGKRLNFKRLATEITLVRPAATDALRSME